MKVLTSLVTIAILSILLMSSIKSGTDETDRSPITRIWRGWTTKENADSFEKTLIGVAIPGIEKNRPEGCLSIQVLRRECENEVEFTTIMTFRSIESIKKFAGNDYEAAHVDPEVKPLLLRYDLRVAHHHTLYKTIWEREN